MPHIKPFNEAAEFEAAKSFRYAGRAIVKGGAIDKDLVPLRHLKMLYENHHIVAVAGGAEPAAPPAKKTPKDKAPKPAEIEIGSVVLVTLDGSPLDGLNATVALIDGDEAIVQALDSDEVEIELTVPIAALSLATTE